jgi:hypothetical protein
MVAYGLCMVFYGLRGLVCGSQFRVAGMDRSLLTAARPQPLPEGPMRDHPQRARRPSCGTPGPRIAEWPIPFEQEHAESAAGGLLMSLASTCSCSKDANPNQPSRVRSTLRTDSPAANGPQRTADPTKAGRWTSEAGQTGQGQVQMFHELDPPVFCICSVFCVHEKSPVGGPLFSSVAQG